MTTIETLKLKLLNTITLDDIIGAILYKSKEAAKPKSGALFQRTFFTLKADNRFSSLLKEFVFDNSGVVPFSDELDSTLFRLEAAEILSTSNPSYDTYFKIVKEPLESSYNKFEDKKIIEECASEFDQLLAKLSA